MNNAWKLGEESVKANKKPNECGPYSEKFNSVIKKYIRGELQRKDQDQSYNIKENKYYKKDDQSYSL